MSDPVCPNFWELYGQRYKVSFDEAYNPGSTEWEKRDPWYMMIHCRLGVIVPWNDGLLGLTIDRHPHKAVEVLNIPSGSELVHDGDDELTITFPVERFEEVAAIVLPYKRRQYTDEEREIIGKRLAPYRVLFEAKSDGLKRAKNARQGLSRPMSHQERDYAILSREADFQSVWPAPQHGPPTQ